ncbi:MAG: hypothetical protein ACRCW3_01835, partial [Metamycoplasmataceae bacterium]
FMGMEGVKQQLPSTELWTWFWITARECFLCCLKSVCRWKAPKEKPAETPMYDTKPGGFVAIRDLRRKGRQVAIGPWWQQHTAMRVAERATWGYDGHWRLQQSPGQRTEQRAREPSHMLKQHEPLSTTRARTVAEEDSSITSSRELHSNKHDNKLLI